MKRILFFLLAAMLLVSAWGCEGADSGRLSVTGGSLTNQRGEPVQLRGLSTHGIAWFPEYLTEDTFRSLKNAGANVVRAAMYTQAYQGYLEDPEYSWNLVTQAIECAKAAGLYIIVDWHILEDGDPMAHVQEAADFFDAICSRYPNDPAILYEICNEPNNVQWDSVCSYADTIFPVIRKHSPDAVIILGTPGYSYDLTEGMLEPYPGENFMYAFHFYAGQHGNYQALKNARDRNIPVMVSEWGINLDENEQPALAAGEEFVSYLNEQGISWCAWSLCNKDEVFSVFRPEYTGVSGWEDGDLTDVGRVIFEALKE